MKTINKIKIFLLLSISIITLGCDDFLDVNESPDNPTISKPSLTLPVAQTYHAALNATSMNYLGNFMVYNYSVPSNWSAQEDLLRYNVTAGFYTTIFETSFNQIFKNLNYIAEYEDGVIDYSAYKVIAQTLKSFQYQYLLDIYGDVPYTEAGLRGENTTPKYDDAETVYKSIIDQLTATSIKALSLAGTIYENPSDADIIFGGDMTNWAQFANTIKLRMLVRLSNTGQDAYIIGEVAKINANGAGYIASDVNTNPGYLDVQDKQNPLFAAYGKDVAGEITDANDFTVASDYAIDYLIGTNDKRYLRLYSEAEDGGYKGVEQTTILPGTGFTSDDLSHIGPGLLKSSTQDQPIFMLSESLLLQAEAMVRGYISGGDAGAQAMYESAIEESFTYLGVPDAVNEAQTYYGQALPNMGWASSPDKIEAIITQKWIASNGTNAIESWVELTRTGFPSSLPIPSDSDGVRPVRLLYPSSEVGRNSENVPAQTRTDAFTSNPFWK
ncbi:SusD/RagB family nutrient-binding outer membrane lipoprotein [Polaribacter sp. ALD11]|uniref:SusD/RagB family nutrient-binding outer membrane lipoprotein n=1 Tax=Polaribacter sp. ALD11 TaxID=2058137 RepID=UPI000C314263|nr:SusD/RagB family nutrient-binding outer membrane lipoprotein [Polaribacter sp. ALD11]AUC86455.1 SusD/RagB family nutrient-binding outer membrane lipoprotein [Polaribacter sp. ALD11]